MTKFTQTQLDKVFHAYDIRGLVPDELNAPFFEALGRAFVIFLKATRISVGRDFRPDSLAFQNAFIKGANTAGCDVEDIGEIATEMVYFAVGDNTRLDGGATITASHNPAGWNGAKLVGQGGAPISGDYGLAKIKEIMLDLPSTKSVKNGKQGKTIKKDIYPSYKAKVLSFIGKTQIKSLEIVVDAGNGIGGKIFDYVFGELPLKVTKLYFEPDGTFPNHVPDPLKEENVAEIKKQTVEQQADIGIAIDGDADRVFFIDNKGRRPSGAYTGAIFAKYLLATHPGDKIIHCPRLVWCLRDEVQKAGGVPVISRVGHSLIKQCMRDEKALFSPETSAHFFYRDFYYCDSGMITIAIMLKLLSEDLDFDETLDYLYATYPNSGEVNFIVKDVQSTIAKIEAYYHDHKIDKLDGISIEFPTWRFNLRGSNTEPKLRLNVEGKTKETVLEGFKEVEALIAAPRDNIPELPELQ
jgi:phosphomannomutase